MMRKEFRVSSSLSAIAIVIAFGAVTLWTGLAEPMHHEMKMAMADALREETGLCTEGALRGRGPCTHTRIAEITPGSSDSQQGAQQPAKARCIGRRPKSARGFRWGA